MADEQQDKRELNGEKHGLEHHGRSYRPMHRHYKHFTWSWYTAPLAALGLSLLISNVPLRFRGLNTIGVVIYLIGLTEFVILSVLTTIRMTTKRGVFRRSITKDSECHFLSAVLLCVSTIIQGAAAYGHPIMESRLATALRAVFWIYAAFAYTFTLFIYFTLFTNQHHLKAADFTPAWLLPLFPTVLTGPTAGAVASHLTAEHAFQVHICGLLYAGLGLVLSILILAIYIHRLFESHFPPPDSRPGLFLAVGPLSFTGVGLLKLAASPPDYGYLKAHPEAMVPLEAVSIYSSIFLWMFSFYLACLALGAVLASARKMRFHLTWYSMVFPNCGLGIVVLLVGSAFQSRAIEWIGSVFTVIIFVVWLVVTGFHIEALVRGRALVVD